MGRFGLLTKEEESFRSFAAKTFRLVDKFIIEVCKTENINENVRVGEIKHIITKKFNDTKNKLKAAGFENRKLSEEEYNDLMATLKELQI